MLQGNAVQSAECNTEALKASSSLCPTSILSNGVRFPKVRCYSFILKKILLKKCNLGYLSHGLQTFGCLLCFAHVFYRKLRWVTDCIKFIQMRCHFARLNSHCANRLLFCKYIIICEQRRFSGGERDEISSKPGLPPLRLCLVLRE
jgi:hypothetical protein